VTRQARVPAAIALVDASNCYDRIAHAMASLVFQAFGVPESAIGSMLSAIENMKFFLRTGFGVSTKFPGGRIRIKTQGLTQGNSASPAGWAVISIIILNAHGKKGHGAKFVCPIAKLTSHLSAILYVDDTDLLHLNLEEDESVATVQELIQASVVNWGNLLIATGGVLQPAKCFYLIISFEWTKGEWSYRDNSIIGNFGVAAPLPGGASAAIGHRSVTHLEKTLGAMTSPDGNSSAAIVMMQQKAQQWIDLVRNGHLHHRNIWFLLGAQFWPRVGYSLCSSTATYNELETALQKQYYQILPLGGIIRTAPLDSRMVDAGFFCPGLPHPGMEALIAMTNKLLMHYGSRSAPGDFMKTSYGYLTLELGISFQPLQTSYSRFSFMATHSWMKMLWEKADKFGLTIKTAIGSLAFPRRGDKFRMLVLMERGHSRETIRRLNRVRIHMQVLFLSDVLTVLGNKIDEAVLRPLQPTKRASMLNWLREEPTEADMMLWKEALEDICPSRRRLNCLGDCVAKSHRIQEWRWCTLSNKLLRYHQGTAKMETYTNTTNSLSPRVVRGDICLVDEIQPGVFCITSTVRETQDTAEQTTFLKVLREWGCSWLWEHMTIVGGTEWIAQAITAGSLLAVTDGSYIRQLYPHLCLAAFVLECSYGRGRLVGSFKEASKAANAYRGELLGLMAIHLILFSVKWVRKSLSGSTKVVSNCLGALQRVTYLPPY
jgi:hypothetical protein